MLPNPLHLCFSSGITKWYKVYTKADHWFQKSHEEYEELQTSSGKSKKLKLLGFCPKNTFLQLKPIQRIYLTLLSTTCVKIHQITDVIFETTSHFSQHNPSVSFLLKHNILSRKEPIKVQFSDFQLLRLKLTKFLMSFFK